MFRVETFYKKISLRVQRVRDYVYVALKSTLEQEVIMQ